MGLLQQQPPQQEAPQQPPQQQAPQQQPLPQEAREQAAKRQMCAFCQHEFAEEAVEALFVWACVPRSLSG